MERNRKVQGWITLEKQKMQQRNGFVNIARMEPIPVLTHLGNKFEKKLSQPY